MIRAFEWKNFYKQGGSESLLLLRWRVDTTTAPSWCKKQQPVLPLGTAYIVLRTRYPWSNLILIDQRVVVPCRSYTTCTLSSNNNVAHAWSYHKYVYQDRTSNLKNNQRRALGPDILRSIESHLSRVSDICAPHMDASVWRVSLPRGLPVFFVMFPPRLPRVSLSGGKLYRKLHRSM